MEHQKCYVFEPGKSQSTKKRKRQSEEPQTWSVRKRAFERLWSRQETRIAEVLDSANEETLGKVHEFIIRAEESEKPRLSAGCITAGPNTAAHSRLFEQLAGRLAHRKSTIFVVVEARDSTNLKSFLKTLISKATLLLEERLDQTAERRESRLLNYDLQLLQDRIQDHSIESVVVACKDTEAFDAHVLSEAIELLHLWRTRIPFILLFGIATSADAFQDRLSRSALRSLEGEEFDVVRADELFERVFLTTMAGDERRLWLGPELISMMLERQKDHVQSVNEFVAELKYIYMSHFFANQTSMWIDAGEGLVQSSKDFSSDEWEAVRNLPSFQKEMDRQLDEDDDPSAVKVFLDSDEALFKLLGEKITSGQRCLHDVSILSRTIHTIITAIPRLGVQPLAGLHARVLSNRLVDSPLLREMMLSLKKMDSMALLGIMTALTRSVEDDTPGFVSDAKISLTDLVTRSGAEGPLRSEHDERHSTVRTTVIAKKAQLSKEKATLSKHDTAYSKLLSDFITSLEDYISTTLAPLETLCFNEIFMYDLRGPHRATFSPRTRFALERALSSPHDYLACDCCGQGEDSVLSASQPPTAILYQLYLESGALINVSDMYSAFWAILGDELGDEELVKALFQRGLAELKHLGMVRPSRKKQDHIAKVAWKGL